MIDEEDRVVHLLASLSDSYDMLVIALKASQAVPKWALVTERLLYEETKIREKETDSAMTLKHHINKSKPKCLNCGKNGHMKHDFWLLREDSKENLKRDYKKKKTFFIDKMPVDSSHSKNDHIVGLFVYHVLLTNNKRSSWIVIYVMMWISSSISQNWM